MLWLHIQTSVGPGSKFGSVPVLRLCYGWWLAEQRSYPRGMTRYPFHMRLGGPQGGSGRVQKIIGVCQRRKIHLVLSTWIYKSCGTVLHVVCNPRRFGRIVVPSSTRLGSERNSDLAGFRVSTGTKHRDTTTQIGCSVWQHVISCRQCRTWQR
jgi:hypothetical protein